MDMDISTLCELMKNETVQEVMDAAVAGASIAAPEVGVGMEILRKIVSFGDRKRLTHICKGLASGLNQEKFTNEMYNYVNSKPENSWAVENTLKKALLAESPIACTLLARMIADHVSDKTPYDRYDVIVAHALETATDEDIRAFRTMMKAYTGDGAIEITDQDAGDWCVSFRLFKQLPVNANWGTLAMEPRFTPTEAANKLLKYLDEIQQLFREVLI